MRSIELRTTGRIHTDPASLVVYMVDGRVPMLPIVKQVRHYKTPHWAPVVFNPGPRKRSNAAASPPRKKSEAMVRVQNATKRFAQANGWRQSHKGFTLRRLAGLRPGPRGEFQDLMPCASRGGQDDPRVFDHVFWFTAEGKPVAIVAMPYEHITHAEAQERAKRYGLELQVPPVRFSGWWLPGSFVRPGTQVRWLPEQCDLKLAKKLAREQD
jgi:hypothetical protein